MSEFLSITSKLGSDPQRIATLVRLVRGYFDGQPVDAVKQEIVDQLGTITSTEMASAVQTLANSDQAVGTGEFTEGHELLMHTLLDEVMVADAAEHASQGHPVDTFMRENRAIEALITEMRFRSTEEDATADEAWWTDAMDRLGQVDIHYTRKENQLFPFLEKAGFDRPSKVMWTVHDEIRSGIKRVRLRLDRGRLDELIAGIGEVLDAVEDMISKEEKVLYPTALRLLSDADWAEIQRGEAEVGYCLIDPPTSSAPSTPLQIPRESPAPQQTVSVPAIPAADDRKKSSRVGTIGFDGGSLTPEELNLLLRHVPLDITYVDEFDEVRFYNRGTERVFPRSPGIIGREVRYCHPPKSVHIVLKIVGEFKTGNRDTAEFWIQMGESFVHIRYFAVRDREGRYRGVIEVSQDVAHLRRDLPGSAITS